jgi:hypothetical protein
LVGYDCGRCGGSGYEKVTVIRHNQISTRNEECSKCFGAGTFTNGKPDVGWDVGITDDLPWLKKKWGDCYESEREKGIQSIENRWGKW